MQNLASVNRQRKRFYFKKELDVVDDELDHLDDSLSILMKMVN